VCDSGAIYAHGGECCAHINFRADDGKYNNIYGPSRATENLANKNNQICVAGSIARNREESLKITEAEPRRIKMSAEYQSQIQQTIEQTASQEIAESDYEDDDMSGHSEPEWMKEYPSEEDSPKDVIQPTRPILTPLEATAELVKLRPIISKPSDLTNIYSSAKQIQICS